VIHFKQLIVNPYSGEVVLLKKHIKFPQTLGMPTRGEEKLYQLTGMLTHIGNETFGHYLSFRRMNKESNQWFVMNDSMSQKTEWQVVQQSKAYMLFY
jgi:ubiquitin C-terminal hydrolase